MFIASNAFNNFILLCIYASNFKMIVIIIIIVIMMSVWTSKRDTTSLSIRFDVNDICITDGFYQHFWIHLTAYFTERFPSRFICHSFIHFVVRFHFFLPFPSKICFNTLVSLSYWIVKMFASRLMNNKDDDDDSKLLLWKISNFNREHNATKATSIALLCLHRRCLREEKRTYSFFFLVRSK